MGGGGYKTGGGPVKFYPYEKRMRNVLAILKEGHKSFHPIKGGGVKKFYPVLGGGGHNKFWTHDFPIL